ncbi:helicase RepA family protein [Maritimibacter sp. UBA3975]|uniref:AAA family ATPase n=1 Tax=Maritimibacter sp. UBA3975 TaxID=1946833 RepID=UPI000C0A264D|nr:helicase RepA family protein [Maritimibacter sp. UBA3975]MAM63858.1 hypothetical protein [Maritimibacter sp.]|tara:strand:- start:73818 stop:74891 length:1074 start_codon:yes stop_codon:yes gene_type:complete
MTDMTPQVVPFQSKRGEALRGKMIPLAKIKPCLDANYLVQGWLGAGGLSVLYGPSNSGKTFVAVDLAAHVASGTAWRGYKIKPGPVVYVAAEGGGGIRNRVSAIRNARPDLLEGAEFSLLPTNLDLHEPGDAMALCDAMPTESAALVVIDTMARCMGSGDENSARDVAQFVINLDAIRERTGAHVLVVHHSGKNAEAGARGSSALRAAVDTEIAISEGQISCVKQRDMETPDRLFFGLETVELGKDSDGDPVTSAVVRPADAPKPKRKPLSGQAEVAMQALREALREHGATILGPDYPEGCKSVPVDLWREACDRHGLTTGGSESAHRMAFMRVKNKLLELNEIRIFEDQVWSVQHD